ncbi:unnamed protein product [Mytilus coruscus]|uniref:C-type lectin domain-containing protein n=1 Tax=Mytilus coruscus TaxID=42192 RepID=A0A6J8C7T2_MYTCO|nr:unnamed protein product [Mytilus coruscus]
MDYESYNSVAEVNDLEFGNRIKEISSPNKLNFYEALNRNNGDISTYDDLKLNQSTTTHEKHHSNRQYFMWLLVGLCCGSVLSGVIVFFATKINDDHISNLENDAAPPGSGRNSSKGYRHIFGLNKSIKLYEDHQSWVEAQKQCVKDGGRLIVLNTESKDKGFLTYVKLLYDTSQWWIGASDREKEGTFRWVTGDVISYNNWDVAEPDDMTKTLTNADCVIYIISGKYGRWYDRVCHFKLPFACEKNATK